MAEALKFIFVFVSFVLLAEITTASHANLLPEDDNIAYTLELLPETFMSPLMKRNDFFLKAAKSVPRIGRRNDFFYAKTLKSVPRIGRRNDYFMNEAESVPGIERRGDFTNPSEREALMSSWPWFRDHESIPRVLKRGDHNHEIQEFRQQPLV